MIGRGARLGGGIKSKIRIRIKSAIEAGVLEFAFEGEFFAAEGEFLFLNGGVAFADFGVPGFVDDGGELLDGVEVGGVAVALVDGSEVEGLLFEEFEGVGGKGGVAGGSVTADFGGGFFGLIEVGSEDEREASFGVASNGHVRDFALPFGEAIFGDLAVRDLFIEPGIDALELGFAEADEFAQAAGFPNLSQFLGRVNGIIWIFVHRFYVFRGFIFGSILRFAEKFGFAVQSEKVRYNRGGN